MATPAASPGGGATSPDNNPSASPLAVGPEVDVSLHPASAVALASAEQLPGGREMSFFDSLASYGFVDNAPEKFEWLKRYASRLQQQEESWAAVQESEEALSKLTEKQYKQLTRQGIPAAYRARVWWHWLAPSSLQEGLPPDYYLALVASAMPPPGSGAESACDTEHARNILKDVDRTFTTHTFFRDANGPGVKALTRVLTAYATRNAAVGYCQGMNFLAAFLLLFYPEEEAFWMLAAICEKFLPADYYSASMLGVAVDVALLMQLLQKRLPRVWAHLQALECTALEGILTGWLLCCFLKVLPVETTLRVWDSLFVEGPKVLFRVGVALVKRHSAALLACDEFGQAFQLLNRMGANEYDCDALMKEAFAISNIKRSWIDKERKKQHARLSQLYAATEARRLSLEAQGSPSVSLTKE